MERNSPQPTNSCVDGRDLTASSDRNAQLCQDQDILGYYGLRDNGELSEIKLFGFKRAHDHIDMSPYILRKSIGKRHCQIEWVNCQEPEADTLNLLPASRIFIARSTQIDAVIPSGLTLEPLEVDQRVSKVWALLLPPVPQDTQDNWAIAISNMDERNWTIWEIVKTSFGGYKIEVATSKLAPPAANGKTLTYLGEVARLDAIQMVHAIPWEISENPKLWTRRDIIMETWYALYEDDALNLAEYEFGKGELTKTIVLP